MRTLAKTLAALLIDAVVVALILVTLAGLQYLFALLPLSGNLKSYLTVVHESTTLAIFAVFVVKAVLRLLLSTSEQVDELTQALRHGAGKEADDAEKKNAL